MPPRPAYRWELLGLLWIAFFLHQADRQIYNNLLPLIEKDLQLSKPQLGLVTAMFTWIYGLRVPVGGYVGDRWRRKWIIILMLLIWSLGTLLTGLSAGLLGLIVFRGIASGFGEAFYAPSANSLLTQWHDKTRALALSLHQTALYTGIVASFAVGILAENFGWGGVIIISSVHEITPTGFCCAYSMSKGGMRLMMRELALEYSRFGITINNVAPGAIRTDINREVLSDPAYEAKVISKIPAGFIGLPEDVSKIVVFLASDEARYITGATIVIDGGLSLR